MTETTETYVKMEVDHTMKRTGLAALAAALLLAGCGQSIGENESMAEIVTPEVTTSVTTTAEAESQAEVTTETKAPDEKKIEAQELTYKKYSKTYEAEEQEPEGDMKIVTKRAGFSGKGYVTGLDEKNTFRLTVDLPESQYYNITFAVAADKKSKCTVTVDGAAAGEFSVAKDGKFALVTLKNIFISKGEYKLTLQTDSGAVDLDYVKLDASAEVSKLKLGLEKFSLSNKNADCNAKALYEYICQSYGKTVLTGQHDTVGSLTETRTILELTGRSPAIRFGDLMPFTQDMIIGENELEYAERWADEGGIVSYMWHWYAPGEKSCYADETSFDLTKAVTEEEIYNKPLSELENMQKAGKISNQCLLLVKDIDKISEKLKELQDKGIAVIWRPLHEAANGYFWWGRSKASYTWLWKLLYQRQTEFHKLNNLIWVWSAQDKDWYVGDKLCDIISADIYDQGNTSGQVEKLLFMQEISKTKPIAMSECGTTPSIQSMADQHALWSYVGQWGGSYLLTDEAALNEQYNTLESLVKFYSNDLTVTRDELPDLKARAAELEAAAKEADKKPAETTAAKKDTDKETAETTETEKTTTAAEKETTAKADSADKKTTTTNKKAG